jgi:dihydroorotate dehydrogenase (fumarate)
MLNTAPTIAGVHFPFCLMNAAGALSTSREELLALAYSAAGAVVTKSITQESFLDPGARCGIENPGVAYYAALLPELRRAGKPVITSVAGLSIEEFISTAQALAASGADLIEINLNDPHVHTHVAPFASVARLREVLATIRRAVAAPLAVKFPSQVPLPLTEVAKVLVDAAIPVAVCHNTALNGAPSQAQTILQSVSGKVDIIGVGGVLSGADAVTLLQSGIKALQVASAVMHEGPSAFTRLKRELASYVEPRVAAL